MNSSPRHKRPALTRRVLSECKGTGRFAKPSHTHLCEPSKDVLRERPDEATHIEKVAQRLAVPPLREEDCILFDLMTTTGVLFTYTAAIPDRSQMQMVEFTIDSPFTAAATVLNVNVASLALVGKSVEQVLVEHVERCGRVGSRK